jgi:serine/threonine protein kinase
MLENSTRIYPPVSATEGNAGLPLSDEVDDFSSFLEAQEIEFFGSQYYWHVGHIDRTQGWILHLSIVHYQLSFMLQRVIPVLIKEKTPFKVVRKRSIADKLLNGSCGSLYTGKIIGIYASDDLKAAKLAATLITLTKDLKGPSIPTDFQLGNIVYTRYGSFSPVLVTNDYGRQIKHIYNASGGLIPDPYNIPFLFPPDVEWPFREIAEAILPKINKLMNARYYPILTIRQSHRGNVQKAIYFKRIWDIRACVIKQGLKNTCTDINGRDVADRLRWQYDLSKRLEGVVALPKVFDYFIENGDTYLVMEFVKGQSLLEWLSGVYKNRTWFNLPEYHQKCITNILIQIVDIVHRLHQNGLIHRDITPGNFMITPKNKAIPIDLELSWPTRVSEFGLPFNLGTRGFMSPQQEARQTPTVKDDVYALGALIVSCYTNLNPAKIVGPFADQTFESLSFLTNDSGLSRLLADCLEEDPVKRPTLETLREGLSANANEAPQTNSYSKYLDTVRLRKTIQLGLNGLAESAMLSSTGRWISLKQDEISSDAEIQEIEYCEGWHTGMAGPLWLVASAATAGFDVAACQSVYCKSWDYIFNHYFGNLNAANPSLYHGGAGIAMALAAGLESGLLPSNSELLSRLQTCFEITASELSLSIGVAGQGMAILHARNWMDKAFAEHRLNLYASAILNSQRPDGSWDCLKLPAEKKQSYNLTLDDGISGIVWFLLAYCQYYNDQEVNLAIEKAMNWLINAKENQLTWRKIQDNRTYTNWSAGQTAVDVSMLMIRAYELQGKVEYKNLAEKSLSAIPREFLNHNFSLDSGLARMGELYLEAYHVFKTEEWLERASWFGKLFLNTFISKTDFAGYWSAVNDNRVTADLYLGSACALRQLLRHYCQNDMRYLI